jgi:hypothetical protein
MQELKLSKSQRQLFKSWEAEYRSQLGAFSGVLNENLNLKMEHMATELGINLEDGKWTFDAKACAFTRADEPTPKIPGRNAGNPQQEEEILEGEVVT